jgi:glycosyltransferase involved in cell wall biosynthesis
LIDSIVPFVSVVIPTHNRGEILKHTIESLFSQSYPGDRYEIIVVDNASTDGTEEMIHSIQSEAPCSLKYFRKENEGPGAARNLGISKASGDVVAFTDSDCVADHNWLKSGVARLMEGFGLVQGKTLPNPDQPRVTLHHTMEIRHENGFYQTCNMFYWKEILDRAGGFSPDFCGLDLFGVPRWGGEDTDLAWRAKKQGWKSTFEDTAVVFHHVFPLNPFGILFSGYYKSGIITLHRIIKRHPELRNIILYMKIFQIKRRFFFYLLVLSVISGLTLHWGFFLLGVPYVRAVLRRSFYKFPLTAYHRGIGNFILTLLVDIMHSVFFLFTSLVYRSVVL